MYDLIKRELHVRKINLHEVSIESIIIILESLLRDKNLEEKKAGELIDRAIEFYIWLQRTKDYNID